MGLRLDKIKGRVLEITVLTVVGSLALLRAVGPPNANLFLCEKPPALIACIVFREAESGTLSRLG